MKELQQLVTDYREIKQEYSKKMQGMFNKSLAQFFEENKAVKAIVWAQYSPYFNDGDECVFSVDQPTFSNAEQNEDTYEIGYGEYNGENEEVWAFGGEYDFERLPVEVRSIVDLEQCMTLSDILQSSEMEDILLDMFGNHVKVIVTKECIEVEEYDHD